MKPNFALTLSQEGIGLLHRSFPGWHLVGEVALDVPDLPGDLAALREKALALDPSGLRSKVVIPNDQIKYFSFEAGGATGDELARMVRAALEGATPYAVSELAYDYSVGAGQVHVAAVAQETLDEAESFALEHDFNPLIFVAIPENGNFVGEPFFGQTAHAAATLTEGESIERDTSPIRVIGAERLPDPAPAPTEAPVSAPPETPEADTPAEATPAAEGAVTDRAPPRPDTDAEEQPPTRDAPPTEAEDAPAPGAPPAPAFTSIRAQRGDAGPADAPPLPGAARFTPPPHAAAEQEAEDTAAATEQAQAAALVASLHADAADKPAAGGAFTSRRSAPTASAPPADQQEVQSEAQRLTIFGAREPARPAPAGGRRVGLVLTAIVLLLLVGIGAWAAIFLDDNALARLFRDPAPVAEAPAPQDSATAAETATVSAPPEAEQPAGLAEDPAPRPETSAPAAPAAPDEGAEDDVVVAALPQETAPADAGDAREPTGQRALPQPDPADLSPDEARARYAATGIWQLAPDAPRPPGLEGLEDFYQTSIDRQVVAQDAVALPDPGAARTDLRPPTPAPPAPAGTRFRVDERGLVVATEEGALNPDGVRVYAGLPPAVAPAVPERLEPEGITPAERERMSQVRPRPRPQDLIEQNERGALGGRTRTELASLRPRLRPQSAQQLARTDSDAVEAAVAEAAETGEGFFVDPTPQAVEASLAPSKRPGNFARVVKEARAARASEPVSSSQRVVPDAPSGTTVAKAATDRNALRMRRVNLIGVYGKPDSRRALVRLANGRYKKVKVGDRLDGGRVAAIGDDELRLQKRGRSVTLRMPRG